MSDRKLKLALSLYGVGGPGQHSLWKDPRVPKNASIDIDWYIQQAQEAEAAKFDAMFIVDSLFINSTYPAHYLNRLEPLTLLSALAVRDREHRAGRHPRRTSYNSPFNLARRFASLDQISGGRAGWNVVTTFDLGVAGNFGLDEHYDYATRYGRALEFVEVAQGLWDSYEDDAFPADVERDVFLDPSKLHELNHKGEYFSVAGPLNLSRSPQGQPVIFQAGMSEQGRRPGRRRSPRASTPTWPASRGGVEFRTDIRSRAAALAANPDHIVIFPGARPVIADDGRGGASGWRGRSSSSTTTSTSKLGAFARPFGGYDFSAHDPDGPFPDLGDLGDNSRAGSVSQIKQVAREEKLTLRQTVERFTPVQAEPVRRLARRRWRTPSSGGSAPGAYDGLNLVVPGDRGPRHVHRTGRADPAGQGALPHRVRGRRPCAATSGIPIPENRYTAARRKAGRRQTPVDARTPELQVVS